MIFGKKETGTPEAEMGFFDHVEELRWHIIRSLIAVGTIATATFFKSDWVFDVFLFGPTHDNFLTYRALCWVSRKLNLGGDLCVHDLHFKVVNFELSGQFMVQLQTAVILGFVVAFPYILWELWSFVKPALNPKESKSSSAVILFSSIFFMTGVAFGYFIIIPFSINFFNSYTVSTNIANTFSLDNYNEFFTMILLGCGLFFELPMIVFFLSKIGLLSPETMRTYRKHAIVGILVVAAVITPSPDAFTQTVVAVPIFLLYELSIFVSARVYRNRQKEAAAAA